MAELSLVDLEDLAEILQDQSSDDFGMDYYVHRVTGEVLLDTGSGDLDVEPEEDDDYVYVDAIPSYEWYQDMADFTAALSDRRVAADLERALDGKGAFRRFASVTMGHHGHLETPWQQFRTVRAHPARGAVARGHGHRRPGAGRRVRRGAPGPRGAVTDRHRDR